MSKTVQFKQFSLAYKTVIFKKFSTQFSFIWPIDRTLSVLPLRARVDLGVMAVKEYSVFLKTPALSELHHQIV